MRKVLLALIVVAALGCTKNENEVVENDKREQIQVRLEIVDLDGKTEFSDVRLAR